MEVKAFLHPRGSKEAPEHTEYELAMRYHHRIVAAKNAKVIQGSFLQVIDERKPVLFILNSYMAPPFWMFHAHMSDSEKTPRMVNATLLLSTNTGVMLTHSRGGGSQQLFGVRVGDEEYYALFGEISEDLFEEKRMISLDDLLDLLSGEISWENLKGRSYLFGRKVTKEISCVKKNAQLATELQSVRKKLQAVREEKNLLQSKLQEEREKLNRVPMFFRRIFSAT